MHNTLNDIYPNPVFILRAPPTVFSVSNILNPSQTLQGALLPTVTSARTSDYEVQSENLCNPQLEESQ